MLYLAPPFVLRSPICSKGGSGGGGGGGGSPSSAKNSPKSTPTKKARSQPTSSREHLD
ncbi:hypothetical protein ZHAS_00019324 [Anopheles sinensis]|uniref:Uncharacterized protein n=1 Tax=Anopheles sinensis TaxID=74873 RepID=A0A084WM33_ANOSI|nr:hypothetical protein ZHAS_00019324 [Anopheles sinensis]